MISSRSRRDFVESIGINDKKMVACLPRLPFSYVIVIVNCNSVDEWTSILASIRSNNSVDIDSVRFVRLIEFIDWNTNFGIYSILILKKQINYSHCEV